jgi:hypothetical protein
MKDFTTQQADISVLELIEHYLDSEYTVEQFANSGLYPAAIPQLVRTLEEARLRRLSRVREELTYKRRQSP